MPMRFYTVAQLGPKRSYTPEGFLVCHDVPIARTGVQMYTSDEIQVPSPNGVVQVFRDADEVFHPDTIASFEGKPFTVGHPDEFVSPDNWSDYGAGHLQNVRRGSGQFEDMLVADIVVKRRDAIRKITLDGWREMSCGYDAEYEAIEGQPGKARQSHIRGNHGALVKFARGGRRCAIQDEDTMMDKKATWWERITGAAQTKDADALRELLAEEGTNKSVQTADAAGLAAVVGLLGEMRAESKATFDAMSARLDKLEKPVSTKDGGPGDGDDDEDDNMLLAKGGAKPTNDGAKVYTGDELTAVIARAEILAPGLSIPTTDAANLKAPGAQVATLQRKALAGALADPEKGVSVRAVLGTRTVDSLTGDALDAVFTGAAELVRLQNNNALQSGALGRRTVDTGSKKQQSPAEINAKSKEFWSGRQAAG